MSTARAVVLALHGLGHDEATARAMFEPALSPGMVMETLAGRFESPTGAGGGRLWFQVDFADGRPAAGPRLDQEAASRAAIIERAIAIRRRIGDTPLILLGFGQGGVVALTALIERPELFTACGIASGRLLEPAIKALPIVPRHCGKPVFWAHGRNDPIIGHELAQQGQAALGRYAMTITAFDHDGGHELPDAVIASLRMWLSDRVASEGS
ncbi:hypothetical protein CD928_04715 [Sphingopyxis sp. GW247-27LB]|nr:hypothetical protein CD928_04715 [Sphingopyxis sp. GW247-27LB]